MNKSIMMNIMILLPSIFNLLVIFLFMYPSKINKFHPMLNLIILIILTFLISLKMNFFLKTWMSFILFLTMIGGLMIIFMYIVSLTNNELFQINLKIIYNNMMKISFFIMMMMILYFYFSELNYFYLFNLNNLTNYNFSFKEQINMNLLYKKFFCKATMFMMLYLYYTMIIIMNICSINKSPLRQNLFYD